MCCYSALYGTENLLTFYFYLHEIKKNIFNPGILFYCKDETNLKIFLIIFLNIYYLLGKS
jgi:hypothetical protein